MNNEQLDALEKATEKAIRQFPLEPVPDEIHVEVECPACGGDGCIEATTWHSSKAASIQAYGIGADLRDMEKFVELCAPATILSLIAELRDSKSRIDRLVDNNHGFMGEIKQLEKERDTYREALELIQDIGCFNCGDVAHEALEAGKKVGEGHV